MRIHSPVKYHGGKFYLCRWIIEQFPEHKTFVEPFGGGASVLLNKKPCDLEVYNDLEPGISTLMSVLKTRGDDFLQAVQKIEYTKENYLSYKSQQPDNPFDLAVQTYVLRRMSRGGTGGTFCWSSREYGGLPEEVCGWLRAHRELPSIIERLRDVVVRCQDAIEVMKEFDDPNTLFYLDPPYLAETRVWKKSYLVEMSREAHKQIADFCRNCQGKVLLSGYPSSLYSDLYCGWECLIKETPNHSSHAKIKEVKQECLWKNY